MDNIIFVNLFEYIKKKFDQLPLGILSLATKLKENKKYNVEIVDFQYEYCKGKFDYSTDFNENIENMCNFLLRKNPQIISIYTMCNNYHNSVILSKKIKEKNKNVKIIFGGPQATLSANETLKSCPWIDVIGLGEGENTIEDIVGKLLKNKEFSDEPGVAYLKDGQVVNNKLPKMIEDLDELPMLDFSFFDIKNRNGFEIEVGRGCPFSCTFCSTKKFWKRKFRLKTPKRIVEEVKYIRDNYNIKNISFMHDLFTANKSKIHEICDLFIEEKLNIEWKCSSRADTINEEIISKMAKSGCNGMFLGIETGSERMQKVLNKNIDLRKAYDVIECLLKYKIEPRVSFIYGFPEETEEDLNETIEFIRKIYSLISEKSKYKNCIQLHRLGFFSGTELTDKYMDELVYSKENNSTMIYTNDLPEEVISMIKNRELFPQFHEYRTELRDKYAMLEKFVPIVYLRTVNVFKDTFKILMEYYNNDFLALFIDYKKIEEESLRKVSFFDIDEGENKVFLPFKSILSFVNKSDFGEKNKILKEIARFEYSISKFLYKSDEQEKILEFDIDVYGIKKDKYVLENDGPIKVKYIRNGDKKIKILKIS